jgi:hypothetical protein
MPLKHTVPTRQTTAHRPGAVPSGSNDDLAWLVAAGQREEGSPEDFYTALAARSNAARARYNAEHKPPLATMAYSGYLLPGHEDDLRWRAQAAARTERRLRTTVRDLVRQSLLDGHEHAVMRPGCRRVADIGQERWRWKDIPADQVQARQRPLLAPAQGACTYANAGRGRR